MTATPRPLGRAQVGLRHPTFTPALGVADEDGDRVDKTGSLTRTRRSGPLLSDPDRGRQANLLSRLRCRAGATAPPRPARPPPPCRLLQYRYKHSAFEPWVKAVDNPGTRAPGCPLVSLTRRQLVVEGSIRPSRVMAKAFNACFQRMAQRPLHGPSGVAAGGRAAGVGGSADRTSGFMLHFPRDRYGESRQPGMARGQPHTR